MLFDQDIKGKYTGCFSISILCVRNQFSNGTSKVKAPLPFGTPEKSFIKQNESHFSPTAIAQGLGSVLAPWY